MAPRSGLGFSRLHLGYPHEAINTPPSAPPRRRDRGTPITITGTGFISEAMVHIAQGNGLTGAIAATNVAVVSPTEITATTGVATKTGKFNLFVTTAGGTSPANSGDDFTYQ